MDVLEEKVRACQSDLTAALRNINSRKFRVLKPTAAAVSTITITSALNVKKVCRDSMLIALSLIDGDGALSSGESRKRKRKRTAEFFNQVTMRHGTKSIKVFGNGSMHFTGCTSLQQFAHIAEEVCAMLRDVAGIEATDGMEDLHLVDFCIQMINLNFGAGRSLHLQGLRDRCTELGYVASYDADMYPGLNVKVPVGERRVTVLLFKSGKVIITGAKTPSELEQAYVMITDVLDQGQ